MNPFCVMPPGEQQPSPDFKVSEAIRFAPPETELFPELTAVTGLLLPDPQRIKRVFDIVFTLALALAALPLGILIALAIALDSRGGIFFAHTRVGKGGKPFRIWKFRSMIAGSDAVLARYLERNPSLVEEWKLTHKLKDDPRVTRAGRLLRKTSLDELPQVWNVLRGEMSMVGPRPIVSEESVKYGPAFALYTRVRPGLTGLWQVSGRNDTNYKRRVAFDCEYIRNWSLWLDAKILFKTVRVVLGGRGAY
jgi:Undecaprenyl-phosphate galactose phosphotransferase WbaP